MDIGVPITSTCPVSEKHKANGGCMTPNERKQIKEALRKSKWVKGKGLTKTEGQDIIQGKVGMMKLESAIKTNTQVHGTFGIADLLPKYFKK